MLLNWQKPTKKMSLLRRIWDQRRKCDWKLTEEIEVGIRNPFGTFWPTKQHHAAAFELGTGLETHVHTHTCTHLHRDWMSLLLYHGHLHRACVNPATTSRMSSVVTTAQAKAGSTQVTDATTLCFPHSPCPQDAGINRAFKTQSTNTK